VCRRNSHGEKSARKGERELLEKLHGVDLRSAAVVFILLGDAGVGRPGSEEKERK
jgi:hypothetical protein